jgi:hypothetical protein
LMGQSTELLRWHLCFGGLQLENSTTLQLVTVGNEIRSLEL